ncbi:Hsp70 family protein [Actinophytocola sediminis]
MEQVTAVVDFGTSHTVVAVAGPGIPARLVTVDGESWFPSAVFWDRAGQGVVGQEALRLGRDEPARLERRPKARVGEDEVLLGDAVVPSAVLVRTVLVRAIAEAVTTVDAVVAHLVLTHPADWGPTKLGALLTAAQGLVPRVSMMAEPVAAAAWFASGNDLPAGAVLAVLDLGGGTCDAALVRREPTGLEVVACAGLPDLGGEDLDQRIVDHLAADRPELAQLTGARLGQVPTAALTDLARFRDGVRTAKEALSQHPQADVALPGQLPDALLTRDEFENLVRPDLARAVELLDSTARAAGLGDGGITGVQLVGGSSRVPLLAQLLRAWSDVPIRLDDRPEAVVALGAEVALRPQAALARDPDVTGPVRIAEEDLAPADLPSPQPRPVRVWLTVAAVVILAAAILGVAALIDLRGFGGAVAGSAQAPPGGPRLTLPSAAAGEPVTVPGRSTDALPTAERGQFVDYVFQDMAVKWRLDEFDDSAQMDSGLTDLGNGLIEGYHWALVRYTVRAVDPVNQDPDLTNQLYLVDDHGLMISTQDSFKGPANNATQAYLPDYCPVDPVESMRRGAEVAGCGLFAVPDATTITEVAISYHSNSSPLPSLSAETRTRGARVAVTGREFPGARPAAWEDQHEPGSIVPMSTGQFAADVAVVGLVEDASGYLDDDLKLILGGSRAMVLRVALRLEEPVSAGALAGASAALLDERGAPIDPSVIVRTNECVDTGLVDDVSGTVALCVLFAVPTDVTPSAAIVQAAAGTEAAVWRLRS